MLLTKVKTLINFHAATGKKTTDDNDLLSALCIQAMYYIMDKCVPDELLRVEDTEEQVYRNIEDGTYIVRPDAPDFANLMDELMIDEQLTMAVVYYVAFLITKNGDNKHLADEIINEYQANYGREYYVDS